MEQATLNNVNIEDLKKLAGMIALEQGKKPMQKNVKFAPTVQKTSPQESKDVVSAGSASQHENGNEVATNSLFPGGSDMFVFMGFSIPKQTLYLLIIVIIISVVIWYMTRDTTKPKKKRNDNEDE